MSNGHSIITIGSFNKRLLFPFFTGLTHVMIRIGNFILNEKEKEMHPVILNCVMFFAEFLTIILFFIELYRSKSKIKSIKKLKRNLFLKYVVFFF